MIKGNRPFFGAAASICGQHRWAGAHEVVAALENVTRQLGYPNARRDGIAMRDMLAVLRTVDRMLVERARSL